MTTEPTLDRFGNLCYRWISGGTQIEGRVFVTHANCCAQAIRTRRAVEASSGRASFAEAKPVLVVKPLPFRLERTG